MKTMAAAVLVAFAAMIGSPLSAADRLSPALADELLQKSGLNSQLAQLEPSIQGGLNLNPALAGKISEAQLERVRKAFATAYAADRLVAAAKTEIAVVMSPAVADQALVWLNSEVGMRIAALEDEAGKAEGFSARAEAAAERFQHLPQRRVERYLRLADATQAGEGAATIAISTLLATARGVAAVAGNAASQNLDAVKAQIEESRPKLVQSLKQQFLVLFTGAYASLEDKDLDRYIAFNESPTGTAYNTALIKVLDAVTRRAAADAGAALAVPRAAPAAGS